jgi:hypothetical protein
MRLWSKVAVVAGIGTGLGLYHSAPEPTPAAAKQAKAMTTESFNASQDQFFLQAALKDWDALEKQNVAFYKLRSCPYCAMVGAYLDYGGVKYHEVYADPLSMKGMPKTGYALVPQIQFMYDTMRKADPIKDLKPTDNGPFIVDSEAIIQQIAKPMKLSQQLEDPRNQKDRKWIREVFIRTSFVAMNGTFSNAMSSYPTLVPEKYNNGICQFFGANILLLLCKWKILPRLEEQLKLEEARYNEEKGLSNGGGAAEGSQTASAFDVIKYTGDVNKLIQDTADHFFFTMIPPGKKFHGGDRPDVVDIEMYGIWRAAFQSTAVRLWLERTRLVDWASNMKKHVPTTTHPYISV